ncbi:MAG: hypothetical protein PHP02_00350 [Eubacteriales bacterium]|nr:hypothetical protein [Eubacteriales bacterium]
MKRIFRNGALISLALILMTFTGLSEVMKDEVIYARLSALGEVESVYVVNSFESPEISEGRDYGRYTEALPLTQAGDFSYEDGEAAFTMAPGRFYYQGIPEEARLPWEIMMRYTLDGADAMPEELSGATGELGIHFEVNPLEEGAVYNQSLAMTATFTLPGARCLDVRAPEATIAYAGGDITISYVILPGQAASYAVTTDVQDFAMGGAQFAAVRMGVDARMYEDMAAQALEGTPFGAVAGSMMEQFLTGMRGQPVTSFMDGRNIVRSLQFVLLSEEIPVKQAEPAPTAVEEAPDTVWQRILSLFGG